MELLIFGLAIYFVPTIIGVARKAKHDGAIFALNLLLGWTVIGWVGAFVWAIADDKKTPWTPPIAEKKCPKCAEMVKADALVCRFCGHNF